MEVEVVSLKLNPSTKTDLIRIISHLHTAAFNVALKFSFILPDIHNSFLLTYLLYLAGTPSSHESFFVIFYFFFLFSTVLPILFGVLSCWFLLMHLSFLKVVIFEDSISKTLLSPLVIAVSFKT